MRQYEKKVEISGQASDNAVERKRLERIRKHLTFQICNEVTITVLIL